MKFLKRNKTRRSTSSDEPTAQTSGSQQQPASHVEHAQSPSAQQQPTTCAPTPNAPSQQQTPRDSVQQMFSGNTGFTFNGPMTFNNNGNSTNVTNLNPVEQYERHRGRHHSPPPSWGASPQNPYGQQRANYSTAPYASNYGTGGPNLSAFVPNIDPDAYASFKRSCAQYYRAVGVPYLADVLMYDANRPPPSYGHYQ